MRNSETFTDEEAANFVAPRQTDNSEPSLPRPVDMIKAGEAASKKIPNPEEKTEFLAHGVNEHVWYNPGPHHPANAPDGRWYPSQRGLLENVLRVGIIAPNFLEKAKEMITEDELVETLEDVSIISTAKNPQNDNFVSFMPVYWEDGRPREGHNYNLVKGYAGMVYQTGGYGQVSDGKFYREERESRSMRRYVFLVDPKLQTMPVEDYDRHAQKRKLERSTGKHFGEMLRFARVAPRFIRGLIVSDIKPKNIERIVDTMRRVFGKNYKMYFPIYDQDGNVLWPNSTEVSSGNYSELTQ